MDKWNDRLQELALEAQRHPRKSRARRLALTRLIQAVQQSGKLSRKKSDCPQEVYDEALQEVWLYVCRKIDTYDPKKGPAINWINFLLKRRLIDAHKRQNKSGKEYSLDRPIASSKSGSVNQAGMTYLDSLPQPEKTPLPSQLVRQCIEEDSDKLFATRHIRGNPQANFRKIALLCLDGQTFKQIAIAIGLKPEKESTVQSFYWRSCRYFAETLKEYLQT
jgi:DNA-directed RNA polymerase specialized sigma24 family protein